jgi:hypothetical protein
MNEEVDIYRLAAAVIRASEAQLRTAYERLVCPGMFRSAERDASCKACGRQLAHHLSARVDEFLAAVAPDDQEGLLAARRIQEALAEHSDCKQFFVAESGSTFSLYCKLLNQDPARLREALRPLFFFSWSPIVLRRAIEDAIRCYQRLNMRRYRERKHHAA